MLKEQITQSDILEWKSVPDIVQSLLDRGLQAENDGFDETAELQFVDGTQLFISTTSQDVFPDVPIDLDRLAEEYRIILLVSDDFSRFDLFTESMIEREFGRQTYAHFGFEKDQIRKGGRSSRKIIKHLNKLDGYDPDSVNRIFEDTGIIEAFARTYQDIVVDISNSISSIEELDNSDRRHYAQRTLNRLIFVYLIQQTEILPDEFLENEHGRLAHSGRDTYDEFYGPIFRGEGVSEYTEQIQPLLSNYLFDKIPVEVAHDGLQIGASASDVNLLFENILKRFSDWEWHIGGEYDLLHTTSISPQVIGHALERYINQQGSGTYHTPEPLNRFLVRNSLEGTILSKLNEEIDMEYESLEQLFGRERQNQGIGVNSNHIEILYDILRDFHVLDPAVGSGSFIKQAQDLLSNIYLECFEHLSPDSTLPESETIQQTTDGVLNAKHLVARRNIFGVDLNPEAIELTRFRLQLSLLSVLPNGEQSEASIFELSSTYNIRVGNSLIGFVNLGPDEEQGYQARLSEEDAELNELQDVLRQYRDTQFTESETSERINDLYTDLRTDFGRRFYNYMAEIGDFRYNIEEYLDDLRPFHWSLEFADVMESGGFDLVISNPPWIDLGKSAGVDEISIRQDEQYEESQLGEETTPAELQQDYIMESGEYNLQDGMPPNLSSLFIERGMKIANPDGVVSMLHPGQIFTGSQYALLRQYLIHEKTLNYALGFENHGIFPDIQRGYQFGILQFRNSGSTQNFKVRFNQSDLKVLSDPSASLVEISAGLIESYSPNRFTFPAIESINDARAIDTIVNHRPLADRDGWNIETFRGLNQAREAEYLMEEGAYPIYGGRNIYQYVYDESFFDLDQPTYWGLDEGSDYPSARTRVRERELKALERKFPHVNVSSNEVNIGRGEAIDKGDIPMPFDEFRIAYRDVANPTNERTAIAAIIPPGVLCLNTLHTIHPYNWRRDESSDNLGVTELFELTYDPEDLFCLLGILNSIPFDYLMRTKVTSHLTDTLVKESQAPRIQPDTPWYDQVWRPAAELNCYGNQFQPLRRDLNVTPLREKEPRRRAQATIDAAVFHLYGFNDRELVESILDSFYRVRKPRVMDEDYFALVIDRFEDLEGGPNE